MARERHATVNAAAGRAVMDAGCRVAVSAGFRREAIMKAIAKLVVAVTVLHLSDLVAAQNASPPIDTRGAMPEAKGEAPKPEVNRKKVKVPKKRKSKVGS